MMDKSKKGGKDKSKAGDNDQVRKITFHKQTLEELEENLKTKIRNEDGRYFGLTED